MLNLYSPAHLLFSNEPTSAASAAVVPRPAVRYPSPPAALRWLRLQLQVLQAVAPGLAASLAWRIFCTPRRLPLKAWETQALAGSRAGWVPGAKGQVATYEWGSPTAPAVVLVHGWEHRAAFWGAWVAPLVDAGWRVVALDGPAHGRSAGRRTDFPEYAAAIQAVLNRAAQTGPVRAVVAHSFGAAAAVGGPLAPPPGQATIPRLVLLSAPVSPRAVAERFAELLKLHSALVERWIVRMRHLAGREVEELAIDVAGPRLPAGAVLLLHDELDAVVPFAEARQIAAAWPAARLQATRGLGHNRILRDAAVIQSAVAFIEK